MEPHPLSRREFLSLVGVATGASLLASCLPSPQEQNPTNVSTPRVEPTVVPTAVLEPTKIPTIVPEVEPTETAVPPTQEGFLPPLLEGALGNNAEKVEYEMVPVMNSAGVEFVYGQGGVVGAGVAGQYYETAVPVTSLTVGREDGSGFDDFIRDSSSESGGIVYRNGDKMVVFVNRWSEGVDGPVYFGLQRTTNGVGVDVRRYAAFRVNSLGEPIWEDAHITPVLSAETRVKVGQGYTEIGNEGDPNLRRVVWGKMAPELGFSPDVTTAVEIIHGGDMVVDVEKAKNVRRDYIDGQMFQAPEYFKGYWKNYCKKDGEPTLDKVLAWMEEKNDYWLPYKPEWGDSLKIAVSSSTSSSKSLTNIPKLINITHDVNLRKFGVVVWGWDEYDDVKPYLDKLLKFGTWLGTSDRGWSQIYAQGIDPESSQVVYFSGLDFYSSAYQGKGRADKIKSLLDTTAENSYIGDRDSGKVGLESIPQINALLAIETAVIRYYDSEYMYKIGLVNSVSPFDLNPNDLTSEQVIVSAVN